jgi:hypothetical protein
MQHVIIEGLLSCYSAFMIMCFFQPHVFSSMPVNAIFTALIMVGIIIVFCGIIYLVIWAYVFLCFLYKSVNKIQNLRNISREDKETFFSGYRKFLLTFVFIGITLYFSIGLVSGLCMSEILSLTMALPAYAKYIPTCFGIIIGTLWNISTYYRANRINWTIYMGSSNNELLKNSFRSAFKQSFWILLSNIVSAAAIFVPIFNQALINGAEDSLGIFGILISLGIALLTFSLRLWKNEFSDIDDHTGLEPRLISLARKENENGK